MKMIVGSECASDNTRKCWKWVKQILTEIVLSKALKYFHDDRLNF